jgi:transposase InsO family protein
MDFIVGLPCTTTGYDSIWVIVDRLTKVAHFIPVKTTYSGARLTELYMAQIVCLHGVPKKIVSDRGSQFTSRFWQKLHECLDTRLNFSSAYHPQTDGQTEKVVAEPPKLMGPHAPALVSKTSDGYACAPDNLIGSVRVSQGPQINHL